MNLAMHFFGLHQMQAAITATAQQMNGAAQRALAQEAEFLRAVMIKGLRDQNPGGQKILPLSPMTIELRKLPRKGAKRRRRGSTKALIDNGDLLGSINAVRVSDEYYMVGVHRQTMSRDGRSMANLAAIHEYGTRAYSITVTERMRRFSFFLMAQGVLHAPWKVGQKLRHKTPERPFLRPAWAQWQEGADARFTERVMKQLAVKKVPVQDLAGGAS